MAYVQENLQVTFIYLEQNPKVILCFTILRHCWEKLWLMKVASRARFLGEFMWVPSSCGGSMAGLIHRQQVCNNDDNNDNDDNDDNDDNNNNNDNKVIL